MNALSAPAIATPKPADVGITRDWLNANVERAGKLGGPSRYSLDFAYYWPVFKSAFADISIVEIILPSLFRGFHTDDYPHVEVAVRFADGVTWSAVSASQYEFMVPWRVDLRGNKAETYNANLSRALAALMPENTVNRSRLRGASLANKLADAVMEHLETQWMKPALSTLRNEYMVTRAEVDFRYSIDFGDAWKDGRPQQPNLLVHLRRPSFPPYFHVEAVLPFHERVVSGVDELLRLGREYEDRVFSIPWLNRLLSERKLPTGLRFVHGRSFSAKAMAAFEADMESIGREALATEVKRWQERVALIVVQYQGYWLILPDNRMVLWRYDAPIGLLKWNPTDFASRGCTSFPKVARNCVGAVVSPDGEPVGR